MAKRAEANSNEIPVGSGKDDGSSRSSPDVNFCIPNCYEFLHTFVSVFFLVLFFFFLIPLIVPLDPPSPLLSLQPPSRHFYSIDSFFLNIYDLCCRAEKEEASASGLFVAMVIYVGYCQCHVLPILLNGIWTIKSVKGSSSCGDTVE